MPLLLECPSCSEQVNVPERAAGRRVKCPHCQELMIVPENEVEDIEPAPRKRSSRPVEEDERAPRRPARRRDDDEDDERPRRRKSQGASPKAKVGLMIGGGVGLLVLVVGLCWALGAFKKSGSGSGVVKGGTPAGWSAAAGQTFNCYMMGTVRKDQSAFNAQERFEVWSSRSGKESFEVMSSNKDVKSGANEADLLAMFRRFPDSTIGSAAWERQLSKKMITVNGSPCLEVHWDVNPNWVPGGEAGRKAFEKDMTPEMKELYDKEKAEFDQAKKEREAAHPNSNEKHTVVRIIAHGSTCYVLKYTTDEMPVNEANMKIFFDSFEVK